MLLPGCGVFFAELFRLLCEAGPKSDVRWRCDSYGNYERGGNQPTPPGRPQARGPGGAQDVECVSSTPPVRCPSRCPPMGGESQGGPCRLRGATSVHSRFEDKSLGALLRGGEKVKKGPSLRWAPPAGPRWGRVPSPMIPACRRGGEKGMWPSACGRRVALHPGHR
ncbi:hypothetical protein NDU88_005634 [Pleurodeles waltl]|uniref:Uncharacterized protein n=1 Tax=Pleurodeles waltl TaxID=8319 RepID=A0AAV7UJA3_PLEWA|nr:hypothetical protein NDU88_005634 [Pleurodeles waltl]